MKYATPIERTALATRDQIEARVDALERMPAFVRAAVERANASQRRIRPGPEPDAFSLHEHVWHLRDVEAFGYSVRARAIASERDPFLADVDGTRLAVERAYLECALEPALADFERERASNVALLRALPLDAFERRGELEGVGCVSLAGLLERWCDHDAQHRREIAELGARTSPDA